MTKDLFDSQICVECGEPCHFGSGRFVNRYPRDDGDVEVDGDRESVTVRP